MASEFLPTCDHLLLAHEPGRLEAYTDIYWWKTHWSKDLDLGRWSGVGQNGSFEHRAELEVGLILASNRVGMADVRYRYAPLHLNNLVILVVFIFTLRLFLLTRPTPTPKSSRAPKRFRYHTRVPIPHRRSLPL
jgi:hypothetical protein